jgi:hypothetical protein
MTLVNQYRRFSIKLSQDEFKVILFAFQVNSIEYPQRITELPFVFTAGTIYQRLSRQPPTLGRTKTLSLSPVEAAAFLNNIINNPEPSDPYLLQLFLKVKTELLKYLSPPNGYFQTYQQQDQW